MLSDHPPAVDPVAKGPSLREKADQEWQKFQKTLPSWFKDNIKYGYMDQWGTLI